MEPGKHHTSGGIDTRENRAPGVRAASPSTSAEGGTAVVRWSSSRPALDCWLEQVDSMLANSGPVPVARFERPSVGAKKSRSGVSRLPGAGG